MEKKFAFLFLANPTFHNQIIMEPNKDQSLNLNVNLETKEPKSRGKRNTTQNGNRMVKLNVGGKKYTTTRSTLELGGKECFFTRMFVYGDDNSISSTKDDEGYIFIDRNGDTFGEVLDYLRNGEILTETDTKRRKVELELDFYGIVGYKEESNDKSADTLPYPLTCPGETLFSAFNPLKEKVSKEVDRNAEAIEKSIKKSIIDGHTSWQLTKELSVEPKCWLEHSADPTIEIKIDPFNYMGRIAIIREISRRWGLKGKIDSFGHLDFDLAGFFDDYE